MKRTFAILLVFCMLLPLCGCVASGVNQPTGNPTNVTTTAVISTTTTTVTNTTAVPVVTTTAPKEYRVYKENGQWLLDFPEGNQPDVEIDSLYYPAALTYGELKEKILAGDFTDPEKWSMKTVFPKAESGSIKVCNFDELYIPTVFSDYVLEEMWWLGGDMISFHYQDAQFQISPRDGMETVMRAYSQVLRFPDKMMKQEYEQARDAEVYYFDFPGAQEKHVRYIIETEDKTLYVVEKYKLADKDSYLGVVTQQYPGTVPYFVNVGGIDGDIMFTATLYKPTARPSMEFLSQFGVTPYVEE